MLLRSSRTILSTHTLMASTPHAEVWKAAPEQKMVPAKLPVFSAGEKKKKIQVHNYSLKWIKMRVYDAGYVTKPVVYQQR